VTVALIGEEINPSTLSTHASKCITRSWALWALQVKFLSSRVVLGATDTISDTNENSGTNHGTTVLILRIVLIYFEKIFV
jgi:hypothetical protein